LQCVAVCCSVLQCVAVCCSVVQCGAVCCSKRTGSHSSSKMCVSEREGWMQGGGGEGVRVVHTHIYNTGFGIWISYIYTHICVAVCCSVLQCVAVWI